MTGITEPRLAACIACIKSQQTVAFVTKTVKRARELKSEFHDALDEFPVWFAPEIVEQNRRMVRTANYNRFLFVGNPVDLKGWTLNIIFVDDEIYDEVKGLVCQPYAQFIRMMP